MDVLTQEKEQLDFIIGELNEIITRSGGLKSVGKEFVYSYFFKRIPDVFYSKKCVLFSLSILAFGDNFEVSVNFRTKAWVFQ